MSILPTGAPDFQAYASWRSANQYPAFSTSMLPGNNILGLLSVFNFASVELLIIPLSAGVTVTVGWYTDSAGLNNVALDTWNVGLHTSLHVILPCRANYVKIIVNNTSGATQNVRTFFAATNSPVTSPVYPVTGDNVGQIAAVFGAGVSTVNYRAFTHSGHGHLTVWDTDGLAKLTFELNTEDQNGVKLRQLLKLSATVGQQQFDFPWPAEIVSLTIANTDLVNPHNCNWYLWSADY